MNPHEPQKHRRTSSNLFEYLGASETLRNLLVFRVWRVHDEDVHGGSTCVRTLWPKMTRRTNMLGRSSTHLASEAWVQENTGSTATACRVYWGLGFRGVHGVSRVNRVNRG